MDETTRDLAYHQAVAQREGLDELWARIDVSEEEYWEQESPRDAEEAQQELEDLPLEVVYEMGEPFAVVLGTGGPHVEITGGGRQGGYTLHVYWGGEHVTLSGESITRTGEYFRELVESTRESM